MSADEKKRVFIANKKAIWERELKLKGGATVASDQKSKDSKWRTDSQSLRDAIRAFRAKGGTSRKTKKRAKHAH